MHQTLIEQLTDHIARPTRSLKLVHISAAIGVHTGKQWHHARQDSKVVPINHNASRTRHRHPVNEMVCRAPCGQQGNHGIDNATLIHHAANGCKTLCLGNSQHRAHCLAGKLFTHLSAWVDKCRTRHMQTHSFQEHLVAIGSAIKSTCTKAMVGGRFSNKQIFAPYQPLGRQLAHLAFFVVGKARCHRPGRHKHHG